MQYSIGNVKRGICHVTCGDKWHVKYNVIKTYYKYVFNSRCFESISKIPPPPPPCWTKKTLLKPEYNWRLTPHNMMLLPVLEGGTYTSTERTINKKPYRTCLIWKIVLLTHYNNFFASNSWYMYHFMSYFKKCSK